jgi:thiol-disulfide isomerase/thioredoxin
LLAGQVLDRLNRRPAGAAIQVLDLKETTSSPTAKIEVAADDRGFFTIQGLKPGRPYQLIARSKDGTRMYSGAVVAQPPNPRLTIFLSEDVQPGEVPPIPAQDTLPTKPMGPTGSGPAARLMNPLAVPNTPNPFTNAPEPAPVPTAPGLEAPRANGVSNSANVITSPIQLGEQPKAPPAPIATNPNGGPPVLVMPAMPAAAPVAVTPPPTAASIAPPVSAPGNPGTPLTTPPLSVPLPSPSATTQTPAPVPAPVTPPPAPAPAPTGGLNNTPSPTEAPGTETGLPTDRIARGATAAAPSPLLSISPPTASGNTPPAPLANTVSPAPSCVLVGNKLEQMALLDLEGKTWEFSKNRRGKVVLFDFWYSNCNPCLKSIPHLKELQRLYGPYGLEVIGLAYESGTRAEQVSKVRMVQSRLAVNYNSLLGGGDSCPVRHQFDVHSFPSLVLVDEQGNILWRSPKGQGIDRRALGEVEMEVRRRLGIR